MDYLSLIVSEARYGLLGIVTPTLGVKKWNVHDPRLLIAAIRAKISSEATSTVQPASKVFQSIMMSPSAVYNAENFAKYGALMNQALDVHEAAMADAGIKQLIQWAIGGMQPSYAGALAKDRLSDAADWPAYWQVINTLEEQLQQCEIINRAILASTNAQKKYSDDFRKLHPAEIAIATPAVIHPPKVPTHRTEWQDRKQPKSNKTEMQTQKPLVDKPCLNCGPRQGSRHLLNDCKHPCFHHTCRDKPAHMAATCKIWTTVKSPKKANKVLKIVDEDDEYDYEAAEVCSHRSPSIALHAKHTPSLPAAGRSIKKIYDAGSNVFIGPFVPADLQEAPITPIFERPC